jgi:hypothetical protein
VDQPGHTTEDLQHIRQPLTHPTDHDHEEIRARRFGRRMLVAGIASGICSYMACLAAAIISDQRMFTSREAQLFAILGVMTLLVGSVSLIIVGGLERLMRPVRARQRWLAGSGERLRILVERMALDQQELYQNLAGLVAPLPGRLERNTDHLAHIEQAMSALAAALPDELLAEHWRGFNEAVKEGFGEKTGTDGSPGKPARHLGLAHPEQPRR